ncbi:MAG TPA: DoxX family protein [Fimbriimonadales bacterium]|nr:DoxX family protein [Fimbriimonadales bacterium]
MNFALLILRIALGVIMVAHGAQKLGWIAGGAGSLAGTVEFFQNTWNIPPFLTYCNVAAEFLGGLGVLVGLLGRIAAAAVAINMIVAIFVEHWPKFFNSEGGFEFPMSLFAIALALLITGMGQYSLDAVIAKGKKQAT